MGILKKSVTAEHEITGGGFGGFTARLVSSGLYVGYLPAAQGTFGSLWGIALCLIVPEKMMTLLWLSIPALFFTGVWSSYKCEIFWGHDPGRVVIDEIVGMLIAIAFLTPSIKILFTGFILFRLFDIFKPPPVRLSEKLPGGWGVMADDVIAGIYAHLVLRGFIFLFPGII